MQEGYVPLGRALQIVGDVPLSSWGAFGLVPKEGRSYNLSFLYRLKEFSGNAAPTRERAMLCMLEWRTAQSCQEEWGQIRDEVSALHNKGKILLASEVSELLGYDAYTVRKWVQKKFLPGIMVAAPTGRKGGVVWIFLRSDVLKVKRVMDGMTAYEASEKLGVALGSVNRLAREGKLPAIKVPSGWRFDPDDVEVYLKTQEKPSGVSAVYAANLLGVPLGTFHGWVAQGFFSYTVGKQGFHYYDLANVTRFKQQGEALRGGFDWMSASLSEPTYSPKAAAKKLSLSTHNLSVWTQEGLLPHFDLGPAHIKQQRRHYVASYVDELAELAQAKHIKPSRLLAREFKNSKQEQESHL